MPYTQYSDSYLMNMSKLELIELLRCAEHNYCATEEAWTNSVKAGMEISKELDKAKTDTIPFLEEENASMLTALTELQLAYNEQMVDLRNAKRLLRLAVADVHELLCDRDDVSRGKGQACRTCSNIMQCACCEQCTVKEELRQWRYADEALKLIGEDGEHND